MGKWRLEQRKFFVNGIIKDVQRVCGECCSNLIHNGLDNEMCEHCGKSFKNKERIYCYDNGQFHYCSKCFKWLGKKGKLI